MALWLPPISPFTSYTLTSLGNIGERQSRNLQSSIIHFQSYRGITFYCYQSLDSWRRIYMYDSNNFGEFIIILLF